MHFKCAYDYGSLFINSGNIATPDGMPLAKVMKMLYGVDQDRVAGMDLMPDIMKTTKKKGYQFSYMAQLTKY